MKQLQVQSAAEPSMGKESKKVASEEGKDETASVSDDSSVDEE